MENDTQQRIRAMQCWLESATTTHPIPAHVQSRSAYSHWCRDMVEEFDALLEDAGGKTHVRYVRETDPWKKPDFGTYGRYYFGGVWEKLPPHGVVLMALVGDLAMVGNSLCSPRDRFDPWIGRWLALRRGHWASQTVLFGPYAKSFLDTHFAYTLHIHLGCRGTVELLRQQVEARYHRTDETADEETTQP